jgi:hypothetical protein
MRDIRELQKIARSGDKIIAKQCPGCRNWFTTRLRSRVLCLHCEAKEGQSPSAPDHRGVSGLSIR